MTAAMPPSPYYRQADTSHPYYLVENVSQYEPAGHEFNSMQEVPQYWDVRAAIIIDDEDLSFGGKPLSELHEEDRRRFSVSDSGSECRSRSGSLEEEERRGRPRQRQRYPSPRSLHRNRNLDAKSVAPSEKKA